MSQVRSQEEDVQGKGYILWEPLSISPVLYSSDYHINASEHNVEKGSFQHYSQINGKGRSGGRVGGG